MDELLKKLIGLIEGEKRLYGSLLAALQDEKASALSTGVEALERAVKEKENVLLKIRILEEQRKNLLGQVAESLDLQPDGLTLTRLAQKIPEPYAAQVRACRSSLLSLTQSIQELNNSNRRLFKRSLELVKGSINLLVNLRSPYPVYGQSGRLGGALPSGRVLSGNV